MANLSTAQNTLVALSMVATGMVSAFCATAIYFAHSENLLTLEVELKPTQIVLRARAGTTNQPVNQNQLKQSKK